MSSSSGKSSEVEARYANMDEKKRKRMQSNRESARRSRMRREQRVKDLVNEIGHLKDQILEFNRQYNELRQRAHAVLLENESLSNEKMRLAKYLNDLYSVHARFAQMQMGCFSSNQPWQAHGQLQPIISTGMSKN